MLNAGAKLMSVDELLVADYRPNTELFLRRLDDSKVFTGRSMRFSDCGQFFRDLRQSPAMLEPLTVVVAEVQEIDAEWRLMLVDAKVVGGSMYRPTADHALPAELIQFAQLAAQKWTPAPVFVMDVARVNRSWKIVECNCFNGSRFYDADATAIVDAVSVFQSER